MPAQLATVRRRIGPMADGTSPLLDRRRDTAERVLRRGAPRLRPAARPSRQPVPGARLVRAAAHPLRRDDLVSRARGAGRRGAGLARRGSRQRIESACGDHPVPSGHRDRRRAGRLRRRSAAPSGSCSTSKRWSAGRLEVCAEGVVAAVDVDHLAGRHRRPVAQQERSTSGRPGSHRCSDQASGARGDHAPVMASKPGMLLPAIVRIGPAETELTRMLCSPRSRAR